ncbi:hypothetical protein HMPREF0063_10987 [Aeromicrobium marinum DSM 15272]|uniref:Uncharacterized protein n=1 Tax=Aeromicrobium marinum DSM 15272 TaxID=585531 RepID=E2SAJ7_9ACTN|nr:hypothetical protein [Aeromicrobium marinum]EFQ84271.1 hypothetical protein HMPREF0063_10987 [Aeromicrobium marinum DSM 15272]
MSAQKPAYILSLQPADPRADTIVVLDGRLVSASERGARRVAEDFLFEASSTSTHRADFRVAEVPVVETVPSARPTDLRIALVARTDVPISVLTTALEVICDASHVRVAAADVEGLLTAPVPRYNSITRQVTPSRGGVVQRIVDWLKFQLRR